jgi:peroxiredoxin
METILMMRHVVCGLALLTFLATGPWLEAGKFNKKLKIGDAAPGWSKLAGTDDKAHSLADYKSNLLVIIITCNRCPVAQSYEERLARLAADFKDKDVSVVAINVNGGKAESLENMKTRAKDHGFGFDYLKDVSQESAKAYGARATPTVFLLDRDRKVIYMGAFDDNWQAEAAVERHYLLDAVTAALTGKKIDVPETLAAGCGIPYHGEEE